MSVQIPPPPATCAGFIYTVASGDTLFFIAQRFGVTLNAIIAANPQIQNPNLIFPGQRICVPTGAPGPVPIVECCMLLFRTANVPILPEAEAGGVARVVQNAQGGNVLVSTIGLPPPSVFGGSLFVAWIRRAGQAAIPFQLLQTAPVVIEPGVWVGAIVFGPGEQFAPFQDIIVTAETAPPFITPNLNSIVLIGLFNQCRPQ